MYNFCRLFLNAFFLTVWIKTVTKTALAENFKKFTVCTKSVQKLSKNPNFQFLPNKNPENQAPKQIPNLQCLGTCFFLDFFWEKIGNFFVEKWITSKLDFLANFFENC